jgi:N-acetyl sugar amidotransferase
VEIIKRPKPIDVTPYTRDTELTTKFGLPKEVKFCKICVISNQRPNSEVEFKHTIKTQKKTINFDEEGVCDACRLAAKKHEGGIDWDERERELKDTLDRYRRNDGKYDCLVPGSGGKDSFFAAHVLKYKYGMNPLTVTWAPHIYTDWGWKNQQAWIHAGFDNYLCTPNGRIHRLLTRLAVETIFHPFQAFMFGQKFLAPKMAAAFDIPLVFFGENEAEYGNPIQDASTAVRDWKYFSTGNKDEVFLGGVSVKDLTTQFGVHESELSPYYPADPNLIQEKKISVHYLGYYLKWHPQSCYYYAVDHGGFQASPERTPGTYSKYNSIDDRIDDYHYYTTYIKFGIGRATYDAAQEIRSRDITRDEGVSLVKRFDGEWPERFADEIMRYLSVPEKEFPVASKMFEDPIMTREYFHTLTDQFRSPHLWKHEDGKWKLRHTVWQDAPGGFKGGGYR